MTLWVLCFIIHEYENVEDLLRTTTKTYLDFVDGTDAVNILISNVYETVVRANLYQLDTIYVPANLTMMSIASTAPDQRRSSSVYLEGLTPCGGSEGGHSPHRCSLSGTSISAACNKHSFACHSRHVWHFLSAAMAPPPIYSLPAPNTAVNKFTPPPLKTKVISPEHDHGRSGNSTSLKKKKHGYTEDPSIKWSLPAYGRVVPLPTPERLLYLSEGRRESELSGCSKGTGQAAEEEDSNRSDKEDEYGLEADFITAVDDVVIHGLDSTLNAVMFWALANDALFSIWAEPLSILHAWQAAFGAMGSVAKDLVVSYRLDAEYSDATVYSQDVWNRPGPSKLDDVYFRGHEEDVELVQALALYLEEPWRETPTSSAPSPLLSTSPSSEGALLGGSIPDAPTDEEPYPPPRASTLVATEDWLSTLAKILPLPLYLFGTQTATGLSAHWHINLLLLCAAIHFGSSIPGNHQKSPKSVELYSVAELQKQVFLHSHYSANVILWFECYGYETGKEVAPQDGNEGRAITHLQWTQLAYTAITGHGQPNEQWLLVDSKTRKALWRCVVQGRGCTSEMEENKRHVIWLFGLEAHRFLESWQRTNKCHPAEEEGGSVHPEKTFLVSIHAAGKLIEGAEIHTEVHLCQLPSDLFCLMRGWSGAPVVQANCSSTKANCAKDKVSVKSYDKSIVDQSLSDSHFPVKGGIGPLLQV
ncbi:hypothetical protein C8R45DRAFT_930270 [Mycena sanguinolenta]|nr:hypothetical protein C8R45DRAFT_930270 [Mycena sanguinolenta]